MRAVFCYHKVGPESEEGRYINIDPANLRSHIRFFKRRHVPLIAGREVLAAKGSFASLTFDDCYHSTLTYGLDVLKSEGVSATMYAVSSKVGLTSDWDTGRERPLADWTLLRHAQESGIEIGNHSYSHPRFSELTKDEQALEIMKCDAQLKENGLNPGSFCFPFGALSKDSDDALKEVGQNLGFVLGQRPFPSNVNPFQVPRIVLAFSHRVPMLLYKMYIRPHLP